MERLGDVSEPSTTEVGMRGAPLRDLLAGTASGSSSSGGVGSSSAAASGRAAVLLNAGGGGGRHGGTDGVGAAVALGLLASPGAAGFGGLGGGGASGDLDDVLDGLSARVAERSRMPWPALWKSLGAHGWAQKRGLGFLPPKPDATGNGEVDRDWEAEAALDESGVRQLLADFPLLIADAPTMWRGLLRAGWSVKAQKGLTACASVFAVPGGTSGGVEGVEWFRTHRAVRSRLMAYPELCLSWGEAWTRLKAKDKEGDKAGAWTHFKGHGLNPYAYLPAGGSKDGVEGVDWFESEASAHAFACRHPNFAFRGTESHASVKARLAAHRRAIRSGDDDVDGDGEDDEEGQRRRQLQRRARANASDDEEEAGFAALGDTLAAAKRQKAMRLERERAAAACNGLNGSSGMGDGEVGDEDDASMDDGAVARQATSAEDELGHLFLTQDLSQPTPASGAESAATGTPAAGLIGDEDEAGNGSGDGDDEVEAFPASALKAAAGAFPVPTPRAPRPSFGGGVFAVAPPFSGMSASTPKPTPEVRPALRPVHGQVGRRQGGGRAGGGGLPGG